MNFSKKIFIAVFVTTLCLGSSVLWVAHSYVTKQNDESFAARYSVFSTVLGDTLSRLDTHTEALMLNAAKVIAEKERSEGVLSNDKLKSLRDELNVTHIFVVNRSGDFIRSTNEDPKLIPNAFSFCPAYRDLYAKHNGVESTPVIHPSPEPKPYKFLYIPSHDKQRLLEVGIRVDFVAKTLTDAIGVDPNVISMSLYDPNGLVLGQFKAKGVEFAKSTIQVPNNFPAIVDNGDQLNIYTKVASSHPHCCQCEVIHISKNGEYYYVLESKISKSELKAVQASSKNIFFGLMAANLLLALAFSRFLSRRLVKNIELAAARVRYIKEHGGITERIRLPGDDEVAYLTSEFDRLLDTLQDSQQKIVEAEKMRAKMQMAREVAHNMRSPAIAIEVSLPFLVGIPERMRKVLKDSASEIKNLAERLKQQSDPHTELNVATRQQYLFSPSALTERVVRDKQIEYSQMTEIKIALNIDSSILDIKLSVDPGEFRAILSNLINNAIESYNGKPGTVEVCLQGSNMDLELIVRDYGKGMPEDLLERLGRETISFEKIGGTGLGLLHMYRIVSAWGAEATIDSKINVGTKVTIRLSQIDPALETFNSSYIKPRDDQSQEVN